MKYGNKKIETEDGCFDSLKEYKHWRELKLMERAGLITQLSRQTKFELIPNQIEDGRVAERAVTYKADFTYYRDGNFVCEDVKSRATKTRDYIIKRKLMRYVHGIKVKEIC